MATTITWHGHSNVLIESGGAAVLVDPFFEGNPFAPDWRSIPKPDVIAVTHDHGDHLGNAVDIAKATGAHVACLFDLGAKFLEWGVPAAQMLNGQGWNIGGTVEAPLPPCKTVRLTMTPAVHSAATGVPAGFVIEFPGGVTVYHAGDTALFGDMALIGDRFDLDAALVPAGGVFTMDAEDAARACAMLKARRAMPIHYRTFPALTQKPDAFTAALALHAPECEALLPAPGETVTF